MRSDLFRAATARQIARELAGLDPGPGFDVKRQSAALVPAGVGGRDQLEPVTRRDDPVRGRQPEGEHDRLSGDRGGGIPRAVWDPARARSTRRPSSLRPRRAAGTAAQQWDRLGPSAANFGTNWCQRAGSETGTVAAVGPAEPAGPAESAGPVMAVELDIVNSPADRELALEREKAAGRIRRDAKKAIEAEERGPVTLPKIATLRERLALPQQETPWRIHNWQPQGSRVICAAQFKTGKTTLMGNTIRSLVDGASSSAATP